MSLSQVSVPSSPVIANNSQLCTAKYYGSDIVSLGVEFQADVFGGMVEFRSNLIEKPQCFDQSNLFMCKYLSLRGSSFTDF